MPRTTGCIMDPKCPYRQVIVCEHGGFPTGLSYWGSDPWPLSWCFCLGGREWYRPWFYYTERFGKSHWPNKTYIITFYQREIIYQDCKFHSIVYLLCYRYAIANDQKTFATGIRKWSRQLVEFPTPKFTTTDGTQQARDTDWHIHISVHDRRNI